MMDRELKNKLDGIESDLKDISDKIYDIRERVSILEIEMVMYSTLADTGQEKIKKTN